MKPVRLLYVAVALALCASLAWGVGFASATELCADPNCEEVYEAGQAFEGQVPFEGAATFVSSLGTVVCGTSSLTGETTAESGEPLTAEVTAMTYEGCLMGGVSCTVTAVNLPYSAAIEETSEGDAAVMLESSGAGNPGAKLVCSGITCTGTAAEVPLNLRGGSPAVVSATNVKLTMTGLFCPATAESTLEYMIVAPLPLQAGPNPTVLCTAAPDGKGVCPKGKQYAGGKIFGAQNAGAPTFEEWPSGSKGVTCKTATFEGDYDKTGHGKVEKLTITGEGMNACASTYPESKSKKTKKNPTITATLAAFPFANSTFKYKPVGGAQGEFSFGPTFEIDKPAKQPSTKLELFVENTILCTYRWTGPNKGSVAGPFTVSNGGASQTVLSMAPIWIKRAENPVEGLCPNEVVQYTNLALTRPEVNKEKDIYIASSVAP